MHGSWAREHIQIQKKHVPIEFYRSCYDDSMNTNRKSRAAMLRRIEDDAKRGCEQSQLLLPRIRRCIELLERRQVKSITRRNV